MRQPAIAIDDPRAGDVRALLERHLAFARSISPPEDTHALGVEALTAPGVTFFSARLDGELLGVAALKELDPRHGEVKSMHTAAPARGSGIARALVDHVVGVALARGYERLSLETGVQAAFAPARALYARSGFVPCEPFGAYAPSRNSTFMTRSLVTGR